MAHSLGWVDRDTSAAGILERAGASGQNVLAPGWTGHSMAGPLRVEANPFSLSQSIS